MADAKELMVAFRRGVSEDEARKIVESAGGQVRRRMRTDHPDEVMLLVKTGPSATDLESSLKANGAVTRTEWNSGGFKPMS